MLDTEAPDPMDMTSAMADARQASLNRPTTAAAPAVEGSRQDDERELAGRRILVIEDEPILAFDMASRLSEAGITVVGPAATVEQALHLVEHTRLDGALLDASLNGQPVGEIAAVLTLRDIPFAFVTGSSRRRLPEPYRAAPMISKPFDLDELVEAVRCLGLARSSSALPMRERCVAGC